MYAIMCYFDDQKIILTRQFFAAVNEHSDRDFHSHNCVELAYVTSGTADHIMVFPDGHVEQNKLCRGNYIIIDSKVRHAYKNGSDDFTVINLLFKLSFLDGTETEPKTSGSESALGVTRSRWHADQQGRDIELRITMKKSQKLGGRSFIRLWLDLSGDDCAIDFSRARIGLIDAENMSDPYVMSPQNKKLPFYFLEEGANKWITMYHDEDGYFGADALSSVKGFRGWFAFPIEGMQKQGSGDTLAPDSNLTAVYLYCSMSDKAMIGNYFYIDDIVLTEDYRVNDKVIIGEDRIVGFDGGVLKIGVSGKDGNIEPGAHCEEIQLSLLEDKDFYNIIKAMYPDFKYSKIPTTPVNQVYFDKDGSVFSLFDMCYEFSRKNMHEWQRSVRHALALIIINALSSFDKYIRPKKDNIIEIVKEYVDKHYAEDITLTDICSRYFYSVPYVSHKFKEKNKCSFEQYVRQVRVHRACELLLSTALSVGEISETCGYSSVQTFRKAFNHVVGCSPLDFKKRYHK